MALLAAQLWACLPQASGGISHLGLSTALAGPATRPATIEAGTLGRDQRGRWWAVFATDGEKALAVMPSCADSSFAQWLLLVALTFNGISAAEVARGPREVQAARPVRGTKGQ